ncbi:MAG: hypothetical protein ACERKD_01505 [Prolixibacteraceae bacterium]
MYKKIILIAALIASNFAVLAISPYYNFGFLNGTTQNAIEDVSKALTNADFTILGSYQPEGNPHLNVIAFTNSELQKTTFAISDRGALASVLKVSIIEKDGKPLLYLLNPEYIFWAYLRDQMENNSTSSALKKVTDLALSSLSAISKTPVETGGSFEKKDLKKYHYMMGMERFSDPVALKSFASFAEGTKIIEANLAKGIGSTKLIYKSNVVGKEIVVYGVALLNKEEGEPQFLPIIGEAYASALPYEIILEGKEASMLHGRYRIALHWPELTMMTFSKIMSTPGDIENQLKALTEK